MLRVILLVVAALFGAASARAADPETGEDLVITLVTFGPGDDITSWFGHSALVVENRQSGQGHLYNYGEFSFDDTMLARYALGHLEFWVGERPVERTLQSYRREGRSILKQELGLTPAQRLELARFLRNNALPEHRGYLYDHFTDNCATRPRDVIDLVTGGRLHTAAAAPGRMTLREHTRRYTARSPILSTLFDFVMNSDVDPPLSRWQESFLPAELSALVASATNVDGASLVARSTTDFAGVHRATIPTQSPRFEGWLLATGLFVAVVAHGSRRSVRVLGLLSAAVGLLVGLPGLVLLLMWTSSDHLVTHNNENVLLANPLTLLSFPLGMAWTLGSRRAGRGLRLLWVGLAAMAVGSLVLKAVPGFQQDNWNILALVVPLSIGTATALRAASP